MPIHPDSVGTFADAAHPWAQGSRPDAPALSTDEPLGPNGKIALLLTSGVGTMWCAYAFMALALIALPQAIAGGLLTIIQWISQTFIQLVMLSVIMVGQNIQSRSSDKRAIETYMDAESILHEAVALKTLTIAQNRDLAWIITTLHAREASSP